MLTNKYIAIKTHIEGAPHESMFELKTEAIPISVESSSNNVLVKCLYIAMDPYQINRMKKESPSQKVISTAFGITPGMEISAFGVGRVVASGHPDFEKDDLVSGLLNWGEYAIVKGGNMLKKLDTMGFPLSYHLGVFGTSGFTAYGGFFQVCKPKKGEKVLVSTACGSIGSLVGQYAKLLGCYVVGSAGTQKKVDLLKEKLGFDDAFNYKEETDLNSTLQRCFPDGIDIYFDNVGGEMLEAAVANMNIFGRVAACGVTSEYTDSAKRAAPNMIDVVYKRITIKGYLSVDYMDVYEEFVSKTADYLRSGKMHVLEDISCGIESIPMAFVGLFRGDNIGKKLKNNNLLLGGGTVKKKAGEGEWVPCDYCNDQIVVLFYRADSAKLCFFCDQHVHAANALSRKHLRSQICDICRSGPVSVRCSTDNLVLCQDCHWDAHGDSTFSNDCTPLEGFSRCPSPLELASCWGLDLEEEDEKPNCQPQLPNSGHWAYPYADPNAWMQDLMVPDEVFDLSSSNINKKQNSSCGKQKNVIL